MHFEINHPSIYSFKDNILLLRQKYVIRTSGGFVFILVRTCYQRMSLKNVKLGHDVNVVDYGFINLIIKSAVSITLSNARLI